MKPLSKSTCRFIKKSLGRFIAIFSIIALGVGFYSGLTVSKTAMIATGDKYLSSSSFFDYRLISTLGFTEEDEAALQKEAYVKNAEASKFVDALFEVPGKSNETTVSVRSVPENINKPQIVSGRMPLNDSECVIDSKYTDDNLLGKTVTISADNTDDVKSSFNQSEFTIVGRVTSPLFLNFERGTTKIGDGSLDCFIYVPLTAFKTEFYTEIFVALKEGALIYSDEYNDIIDAHREEITQALQKRADIRYQSIVDKAKEQLLAAQSEYDSGVSQLEAEKKEAAIALEAGKSQLDDATAVISNGISELNDKESQLKSAEAGLDSADKLYNDSMTEYLNAVGIYNNSVFQYQAANEQYEKGLIEYNASVNTINSIIDWAGSTIDFAFTDMFKQLDDLLSNMDNAYHYTPETVNLDNLKNRLYDSSIDPITRLKEAKALLDETKKTLDGACEELGNANYQLAQKKAELDAAKSKIDTGRSEISAGYAAIAEARAKLDNAQSDYNAGIESYESSKAEGEEKLQEAAFQLDAGKAELTAASDKIAEIPKPSIYVLDRNSNTGYVCFDNDSSIVEGIAKVFPVFFFLVAALVCITTMTRMVEENRTHIGTLKAIGYKNTAIASQYIIYSGTAAVCGALGGYFFGSFIFPYTIWIVYGIMYGFAPITLVFDLKLFIISLAVALVCSIGTSYAACRHSLTETTASLIRPKSPKNGKRILLERVGFIWKRLKFLYKVSFRNVFRYKSRMIMMILGVGGCTALLLTGFGLGDSIRNLAEFQFGEITVYDYGASFTKSLSADEMEEIKTGSSKFTDGIMFTHSSSADLISNNGVKKINIVAVENNTDGFINLHHKGSSIEFPKTGEIVLTEKIASKAGLRVGDTVLMRTSDLCEGEFKISGICDNYVYNFAYMTLETYREIWGIEPEIKNAFVNASTTGENDIDVIHSSAARFSENKLCAGTNINADTRSYVEKMMSSLDYIIALVCACAAALAFIVVYNLTNININERAREIATIKVLGFRRGETGSYVFRENIALSIAGAGVGLLLGKLLHYYVMSCIDINMVAFDINITLLSYLFAFGMTIIFACIVDFIMYFKLEKIDMANSLKSIE